MKEKMICLCFVFVGIVMVSCSDDSDKIDTFFKEKIARFERMQPPRVLEVYSNAVLFPSEDYLGRVAIGTDKEKLTSDAYKQLYEGAYIDGLEPSTTYYYGIENFEQVSVSEWKNVYSVIQSFKTPELTGKIIDNYIYDRDAVVKIEPSLYGIKSSKTEVEVEYSTNADLSNAHYRFNNSWSGYYDYIYIGSLDPNTKYYYRLHVTINNKDFYSPISSFTTVKQ